VHGPDHCPHCRRIYNVDIHLFRKISECYADLKIAIKNLYEIKKEISYCAFDVHRRNEVLQAIETQQKINTNLKFKLLMYLHIIFA